MLKKLIQKEVEKRNFEKQKTQKIEQKPDEELDGDVEQENQIYVKRIFQKLMGERKIPKSQKPIVLIEAFPLNY